MQNTEETITKYAVDANLFRLGSTNPKNIYPVPGCFLVGSEVHHKKIKLHFFSLKNVYIFEQKHYFSEIYIFLKVFKFT